MKSCAMNAKGSTIPKPPMGMVTWVEIGKTNLSWLSLCLPLLHILSFKTDVNSWKISKLSSNLVAVSCGHYSILHQYTIRRIATIKRWEKHLKFLLKWKWLENFYWKKHQSERDIYTTCKYCKFSCWSFQ